MTDESYIQLAIEIAKRGIGYVSPNPLVGCIIVKDDRILGAGYHEKYGENPVSYTHLTLPTSDLV